MMLNAEAKRYCYQQHTHVTYAKTKEVQYTILLSDANALQSLATEIYRDRKGKSLTAYTDTLTMCCIARGHDPAESWVHDLHKTLNNPSSKFRLK